MFLTRVYLNPTKRGCRHLVASPQRLHAAVLASFPPGVLETVDEGRVLWRLDHPADKRRGTRKAGAGQDVAEGSPALTLYISSPVAPDPAGLVEQAGYETAGGVATKRIDDHLDSLAVGQTWGFRITVNPVFRASEQLNSRGRKKILGHITVDQQTRWLLDRAEVNGFRILKASDVGGDLPILEDDDGTRKDGESLLVGLVDRRIERFKRFKPGAGMEAKQVTLALATFEGTLRVTDPVALRSALVNGIGRAKGYGAGLLTLARP